MTPTRHPSDAVLADYASGALRSAFSAVVAAHLEHCPHCRDEVAALEAVGGALLETLPESGLAAEGLERVMAALDEAESPAAPAQSTIERIAFGRERFLAPSMGIRKAGSGADGELLYLLRLPSGQKTLPHGHLGVEFTTVLKGAYNDNGALYRAGDFCEMDSADDHQPHVVAGEECVCLIASERPMRMTTRVGWLVQALTGV